LNSVELPVAAGLEDAPAPGVQLITTGCLRDAGMDVVPAVGRVNDEVVREAEMGDRVGADEIGR
jgi:hypothetical protein